MVPAGEEWALEVICPLDARFMCERFNACDQMASSAWV